MSLTGGESVVVVVDVVDIAAAAAPSLAGLERPLKAARAEVRPMALRRNVVVKLGVGEVAWSKRRRRRGSCVVVRFFCFFFFVESDFCLRLELSFSPLRFLLHLLLLPAQREAAPSFSPSLAAFDPCSSFCCCCCFCHRDDAAGGGAPGVRTTSSGSETHGVDAERSSRRRRHPPVKAPE